MTDIRYTTDGVDFKGEFIPWETLEAERNKFRFANSVLVKIGFSYGRVTDIEDCQIYDKAEWAKIFNALSGSEAYYSDFAGKHSQTSITFWENVDVKEITDLDEIISFHKLHGFYTHDLGIVDEAINQAIENGEIDEDYNRLNEDENESE